MACGHCMAICPTRSIFIEGLRYDKDFFELPEAEFKGQAFFDLLASRRSVRVFKDKPVPRSLLERILEAIALAPMGYPPHKIEVTVVPNREMIEAALPAFQAVYEALLDRWANPVVRALIHRKLSVESYTSLKDHLIPSLKFRLPEMRAGGADTITRGAPAMMLFHARRESGNHSEDALIALTYGLLAAHALGLGATAIGLVPPAIERWPALKTFFQIPEKNEVVAAMILGFPKYRFKRGIRRELAGVNWLEMDAICHNEEKYTVPDGREILQQ
jgi:nitroreductase